MKQNIHQILDLDLVEQAPIPPWTWVAEILELFKIPITAKVEIRPGANDKTVDIIAEWED